MADGDWHTGDPNAAGAGVVPVWRRPYGEVSVDPPGTDKWRAPYGSIIPDEGTGTQLQHPYSLPAGGHTNDYVNREPQIPGQAPLTPAQEAVQLLWQASNCTPTRRESCSTDKFSAFFENAQFEMQPREALAFAKTVFNDPLFNKAEPRAVLHFLGEIFDDADKSNPDGTADGQVTLAELTEWGRMVPDYTPGGEFSGYAKETFDQIKRAANPHFFDITKAFQDDAGITRDDLFAALVNTRPGG
ncbi:MAG: hypothetical protein U0105_12480 [Candidatus Obscuribacterales bacterium]